MRTVFILMIIVIVFIGIFWVVDYASENKPTACTEEAKLCPDGTAVGRTGPDCEFEPCPVSKICEADEDCVVFGKTGDCNCGCYNKQALPQDTGGKCFCAAPVSCKCINEQCEGVFEESQEESNEENSDNECIDLGCPKDSIYVGSINSNKYYECRCGWAKTIKPENIICFSSDEEALADNRTKSEC